jgi:hypothetical protein
VSKSLNNQRELTLGAAQASSKPSTQEARMTAFSESWIKGMAILSSSSAMVVFLLRLVSISVEVKHWLLQRRAHERVSVFFSHCGPLGFRPPLKSQWLIPDPLLPDPPMEQQWEMQGRKRQSSSSFFCFEFWLLAVHGAHVSPHEQSSFREGAHVARRTMSLLPSLDSQKSPGSYLLHE